MRVIDSSHHDRGALRILPPRHRALIGNRSGLTRPTLALTALGFVVLALGAGLVGTLPLDTGVRLALLDVASPTIVTVMRVINLAGEWRVLLPATLLLLLSEAARRRWWIWTGLMVIAAGLPDIVKVVVARSRPEDVSLGFPSGHATAAAAYFGAMMYLAGGLPAGPRRLVRAMAPVCIVLVAMARVVLRAHWPSDTLGGILLGLGLAAAAAMLAGEPAPAVTSGATPPDRAPRRPPS